jgi:hypothetical protein
MTDAWAFDDIETCALDTVVGLLDALMDGSAAAMPGLNAGRYAEDLRRLGDTAAEAAADLELVLNRRQAIRQAVA